MKCNPATGSPTTTLLRLNPSGLPMPRTFIQLGQINDPQALFKAKKIELSNSNTKRLPGPDKRAVCTQFGYCIQPKCTNLRLLTIPPSSPRVYSGLICTKRVFL